MAERRGNFAGAETQGRSGWGRPFFDGKILVTVPNPDPCAARLICIRTGSAPPLMPCGKPVHPYRLAARLSLSLAAWRVLKFLPIYRPPLLYGLAHEQAQKDASAMEGGRDPRRLSCR